MTPHQERRSGRTPELHNLDTTTLQVGDIVLELGMRVRIYAEPKVYPEHNGPDATWVWPGFVENLDEVLVAGVIPESYLSESTWTEDGWVSHLTGRWPIQGNHLARWEVERGGLATEADWVTIRTLWGHGLTRTSVGRSYEDASQGYCGCGNWNPPVMRYSAVPAAHDEHLTAFIPAGTPTAPCPTCKRVLVQVEGTDTWYHADASGFHGHRGMNSEGKPW